MVRELELCDECGVKNSSRMQLSSRGLYHRRLKSLRRPLQHLREPVMFRRFLDRIHLRCDGSQLLGQHVIDRFFYERAAWTTRTHQGMFALLSP